MTQFKRGTDPEFHDATIRAARFVAAIQAGENAESAVPLIEARKAGRMDLFAIALGVRCAQLTGELYGDRVQVELDGWAMDAMFIAEKDADDDR
ncbi:hypothetical protein CRI77_25025 [Mycolicibacterium duvalii]|uniref:Uncharacterized protein n=1 Tax=Mycolicibacterium duvalii TaxID=39688 RepID=A0A7I7K055_9MYCO|nr:hypothetical protein [Mycolicibacterium duvalii]MCV7368671.1 hypothetical protein [Mycolicibacterium duvalii]PEG35629.1 hypothetical protein CRI77_25025 [Mycolicibacterium duvalii]BBX16958.1 hypothetical protein MDUV_18180 [Mycolicibacterium duvalii]